MEEIKPKSAFPIIGDLFTAEIVSSHNLISCWPRGWTHPMACLNEIIGGLFLKNRLSKKCFFRCGTKIGKVNWTEFSIAYLCGGAV